MTRLGLRRPWLAGGKRAADLILSAGLLVLLSPLLGACALLLLAGDGPPILFRQQRVGRAARPFWILKFRSMHGAPGPDVTAAGDQRITTVGSWLRRTKLDELPQLWNVLRGDMSLVGPRPEVPRYASREAHSFRAIGHLRPGIVDWASLVFHDEERILAAHAGEEDFYGRVLLPRKLALARLYARYASAMLDARLLAATAFLALGAPRLGQRLMGSALHQRARSVAR